MSAPLPVWLRSTASGVCLQLHVQPGAKTTEVVGIHGDALKLRLAAPPVEGRANDCLLAYLSKTLGVPRQLIELLAGQGSRRKRVEVTGISAELVWRRLTPGN